MNKLAIFQTEIYQLERTRSSMAEEIVKLSNQTEHLEDQVSEVPELRIQLKVANHFFYIHEMFYTNYYWHDLLYQCTNHNLEPFKTHSNLLTRALGTIS